jgi:hypothetical protein
MGLIWEIEVLRMVAALVVWEDLLVIASGGASRSVSPSA